MSGRRLWGWAKDNYKTPEVFFSKFFVTNYCPLVFMEETGRNRVPEKLPKHERVPVFEACDQALLKTAEYFDPKYIVGVGKFAEKKAKQVLGHLPGLTITSIPHPSPASPLANRGWAPLVNSPQRRRSPYSDSVFERQGYKPTSFLVLEFARLRYHESCPIQGEERTWLRPYESSFACSSVWLRSSLVIDY